MAAKSRKKSFATSLTCGAPMGALKISAGRWNNSCAFLRPIGLVARTRSRAFTLLEVVIAVGIFAIGMVAVIGLFTPAAKSIGDSADAEAATRVADLLNVKLQT